MQCVSCFRAQIRRRVIYNLDRGHYCLLTFRVCRIISKSRTPPTPPSSQEGLLIELRFGTRSSIQVVSRWFPAVDVIVGFNLPRSLHFLDRVPRREGWNRHQWYSTMHVYHYNYITSVSIRIFFISHHTTLIIYISCLLSHNRIIRYFDHARRSFS